jgi:hypothetical protein
LLGDALCARSKAQKANLREAGRRASRHLIISRARARTSVRISAKKSPALIYGHGRHMYTQKSLLTGLYILQLLFALRNAIAHLAINSEFMNTCRNNAMEMETASGDISYLFLRQLCTFAGFCPAS